MTDIFEDLVAEQATKAESTNAPAEQAQENASDWPKRVTLAAGETPEGAVPIAEFGKLVNEQVVSDRVSELLAEGKTPLEAAMEAMTSQVNPASFYQAVKAQRNPLPHYVVTYEVPVLDDEGKETGETKAEEKFFIPREVGLEWWKNRPTRGGGGAARSEEDVEKRLIKAGKKIADHDAAVARYAKLAENIARMKGQIEKYEQLLAADGKTLDDAKAAYEAQLEKEEAEKAIGDNE